MAYNFTPLKQKAGEVKDWLKKEFQSIRTSRATPTLLDSVFVESYGAKVPVAQIASLTTEDARTLRVLPWDAAHGKAIEKAIVASDLGVSVAIDERGVRVMFPELTYERREALVKVLRERLERAKILLRAERDKVWSDIQVQERASVISKDDKFRSKDEMEKIIGDATQELEEITKRKELEILT